MATQSPLQGPGKETGGEQGKSTLTVSCTQGSASTRCSWKMFRICLDIRNSHQTFINGGIC